MKKRAFSFSAPKLIGDLLKIVGKPFYLFLFYLFLGLVFLFSLLVKIRLPQIKIRFRRLALYFPLRLKRRFLVFLGLFLILISAFWYFILRDLPSPRELVGRNIEVSTKIYDRNGILLYKIYKNKNRSLVSFAKIPQIVRLATLAAEDAEFYSHPGFSVRGILRSAISNIKKGELSGGSTITQQLVKNALLSPEKTLKRKIREIILAVAVESTFSKDEILEMYLNEVSYGGTAYGIEEASELYFGKNIGSLGVTEAALLAGLPKSPTQLSPFGAEPDLAIVRQREVLNLMYINKFISLAELNAALEQRLTFAPNRTEIRAPHFVMFIRQALVDKYGEEMVEKGGLNVITTLDYAIQSSAEEAVFQEIQKLNDFSVGNGAALVINPKTGEILAMVGSKNYFDTEGGGNVNVILRLRQPGSSIKVVNYAYALSDKYTAASILSDSPVTFAVPGLPPYSPKNYDGKFRGNLSLRSALAESRNIPAVKVLASYGVAKMLELGTKMGISTWQNPADYGLSLTLGGGEVRLIDLAKVYATLANAGKKTEISGIIRITDYKGRVWEENPCFVAENCQGEKILDSRISFILTDILKDNSARTPAFGSRSALVIPRHPEVAVKTGTSNDLKDNLTVGYNQKYLTAVWVGNNDGRPMSRISSGVTGAAPIWNRIMSTLLADEPLVEWEIPDGLVRLPVCRGIGTLNCEGCQIYYEWFLKEKTPPQNCSRGIPPAPKILEPAVKTER